jgi:hypothetical protein
MGYSGTFSIVKNSTFSCHNVLNMSLMYKWIREEEICKEILNPGGASFMMRMGKLEDRQPNQRRKILVTLTQ